MGWDVTEAQIRDFNPSGIILSGARKVLLKKTARVRRSMSLKRRTGIRRLLWYADHGDAVGRHVEASNEREFGYAQVEVVNEAH